MKVCVTGASGLIGRELLARLAVIQGVRITALSRASTIEVGSSVHWLRGDLQSPEDCARLVEGQDIVIHLAHTNSPLTSDRNMACDTQLNLVPTLNLLRAIEGVGRSPHFIFPSSGGAVYGVSDTGRPFKEEDACRPINSYGIQKLAAEHYIRLAVERGWLNATVLRIANVYGELLPSDHPQGLIGTSVTRVLNGQPVRILGNSNNVRDYVHLEDVCDAVVSALDYRSGYEVFNIGTGIGASVRDVITLIERALGRPVAITEETVEYAQYLPNWCVLDVEKARRGLRWSSKVNLEAGISRLVAQGTREIQARKAHSASPGVARKDHD